ncbi:hypothetical protein ACH5RR_008130 [Cinchona calisaya]|uniref:Auxin-responsive protein n=1 Tax=Cinchona calisaya TaxID=153742 RepID=A0ABD3AB70_9GENT
MAKDGLGLEITELRLGLPGGCYSSKEMAQKIDKKRVFSEIEGDIDNQNGNVNSNKLAKSQRVNKNPVVVGWPPVCSYRRKNSFNGHEESRKMYVKVSMDGAPFLRKFDLAAQKCYSDLEINLEKLFGCYGIGEALNDADSSEYVPIYEDKDGDWMLLGDVPWTMFIESCKRLRIMKRAEAKCIGIHPKTYFKGTSRDG